METKFTNASELAERVINLTPETPQQQVYRAGFEMEVKLKIESSKNWKEKTLKVYIPYKKELLHEGKLKELCTKLTESGYGARVGEYDSSSWGDDVTDMAPCIYLSYPTTLQSTGGYSYAQF